MSNSLQERLSGLDGITVAILSLKYENSYRYVDAHEKGRIAWVTPCSETKIGISDWAHFILHHIEENHVLFESVRFPGYYLDMNHLKFDSGDHIVKISMSKGDITKETWPKFSIHSDSNSDFYKGELKSIYNVAIRSDRYDNRWLDTAPKGSARTFEKRSRQISGGVIVGTYQDLIIPDASSDTSLLRGCKLDKGTMPGDGDTWGRYTIVPVGLKAPLGRWKVQTFADRVNHAGETVITYYSEISNSKSLTTETTISLNAEISGTFKKVTGNLGLGYAIRKATDEQSGTSFGTSVKYTVPDGKKVVVFFYELLYKEYKMFSQQTIVEWPLKDPDKKFLLTNELSLKYEDHAK